MDAETIKLIKKEVEYAFIDIQNRQDEIIKTLVEEQQKRRELEERLNRVELQMGCY